MKSSTGTGTSKSITEDPSPPGPARTAQLKQGQSWRDEPLRGALRKPGFDGHAPLPAHRRGSGSEEGGGETTECAICLELFSPEGDVFRTPCGHKFHACCFLRQLEAVEQAGKGRLRCALCRSRLDAYGGCEHPFQLSRAIEVFREWGAPTPFVLQRERVGCGSRCSVQ